MYMIVCVVCHTVLLAFCFFFFKQKTAYEMRISDWSSDVCSSDLRQIAVEHRLADRGAEAAARYQSDDRAVVQDGLAAEHRHGLLHREGAEPAARSLRLLLFPRGAADEVALGLQVHSKPEAGLVGRVVLRHVGAPVDVALLKAHAFYVAIAAGANTV